MARLSDIRKRCLATTEEQKAEMWRSIESIGTHSNPLHAASVFRDPLWIMDEFTARYYRDQETQDARRAADLAHMSQMLYRGVSQGIQVLAREAVVELRAQSSPIPMPAAQVAQAEAHLRIGRSTRRVCLRGIEFGLSASNHKLMLLLSDAAVRGSPWVSLEDLKSKLLSRNSGDKALGQLASRARKALVQAAADDGAANLIENDPGVGYRLTVPGELIRIEG